MGILQRFHTESKRQGRERRPAVSDTAPLLYQCCERHPGTILSWRCTECGEEFCENCVKPIESIYTSRAVYYVRTAVCPQCKGRCEDFKSEADREKSLRDKERRKKHTLYLRYLLFCVCSFPFLVAVIRWQSNDVAFLLFIMAVFWVGPFRDLNIMTKVVTVINSSLGIIILGFAQAAGITGPAAYLFFYTPVKYLFVTGLTYILFYGIGKASDWAGSIYMGPSAKGKFGGFEKTLLVASLATIIAILIFGFYHYMSAYIF